MAQVTAKLKNYRQSPRKVRLVAEYIKGKKVDVAIAQLNILPKRASLQVEKLISSAAANAKDKGLPEETLTVKNLTVDKGTIIYRRRARARGRAMPIRKRTSNLIVTIESPEEIKIEKTEKKKAKKTPAKKASKTKTTAKTAKKAIKAKPAKSKK